MDITFAQKIRELRNKKGWSVYDLAAELNKTAGYISKIEARGEIPSPEMISRLADTLKVDAKQLFELAKKDKQQQLTDIVNKKYDEGYALYRKSKKK